MSCRAGRFFWAAPVLLALLGGRLSAQTTFATITGAVTDPPGAVVPGATVTATQVEANIQTTAQSNDAGVYTLSQLRGGEYTFTADGAHSATRCEYFRDSEIR